MQSFHLPSHHAINRYFREQDANIVDLFDRTDHAKMREWASRYRSKSRLSSEEMKEMADEHEANLVAANAFNILRTHRPPAKAFPQRETFTVEASFMEPIALGQGWIEAGKRPYTENAIYLRQMRVQFKPRKAFFGFSASGLILTQHLLSRVYERTEIGHEAFAKLLHDHIDELITGLALAETGRLWVSNGCDRVTAVPFADGLLLVNTRALFGNEDEGDFGFHMDIPSMRLQQPYINDLLRFDEDIIPRTSDFAGTLALCGTTYFNGQTLSDIQSDYYYAFRALREEVGEEAVTALVYFYFGPNLAHEKWGEFVLKPHLEKRRDRVFSLLSEGWMKLDTPPIACILPFDTKAP